MNEMLLELIEGLQVKVNAMDEARSQQALYDLGVKKMAENRAVYE